MTNRNDDQGRIKMGNLCFESSLILLKNCNRHLQIYANTLLSIKMPQ